MKVNEFHSTRPAVKFADIGDRASATSIGLTIRPPTSTPPGCAAAHSARTPTLWPFISPRVRKPPPSSRSITASPITGAASPAATAVRMSSTVQLSMSLFTVVSSLFSPTIGDEALLLVGFVGDAVERLRRGRH